MFGNKLTLLISGIGILSIIIFFMLWRSAANEVEVKTQALFVANSQLKTLQEDNARLVEYNKRKDLEIAVIEKKYTDRLNAIPVDKCGDAKPSDELLDFLKTSN